MKAIYKLEYRDFIGRECVREYKATCIVSVMNEVKSFCFVNHVKLAKIVAPSGKIYYM